MIYELYSQYDIIALMKLSRNIKSNEIKMKFASKKYNEKAN